MPNFRLIFDSIKAIIASYDYRLFFVFYLFQLSEKLVLGNSFFVSSKVLGMSIADLYAHSTSLIK